MKKATMVLVAVLMMLCAGSLLAAEAAPAQGAHQAPTVPPSNTNMWIVIAIGFGLAIAVFGGALGQSRAIAAAVDGMARQPEAGGRIFGAMFLGLALIESLVIYMWVTTFLLLGMYNK